MTELRHQQLYEAWDDARAQLADNVRDTEDAFSRRVVGRLVTVPGYVATGATTTRLALLAGVAARAVMLVRVQPSRDPTADVAVSGRLNFAPTADGLGVYEPSGLTQYTAYDLTFLVLE